MSLPHNQNIDARYGVHNNVGGDQYNVQWNVKRKYAHVISIHRLIPWLYSKFGPPAGP